MIDKKELINRLRLQNDKTIIKDGLYYTCRMYHTGIAIGIDEYLGVSQWRATKEDITPYENFSYEELKKIHDLKED